MSIGTTIQPGFSCSGKLRKMCKSDENLLTPTAGGIVATWRWTVTADCPRAREGWTLELMVRVDTHKRRRTRGSWFIVDSTYTNRGSDARKPDSPWSGLKDPCRNPHAVCWCLGGWTRAQSQTPRKREPTAPDCHQLDLKMASSG